MRELAERLVAAETAASSSDTPQKQVEFQVVARLRPPLRSLAGAAAFHSLLSRALALMKVEFPRLSAAQLQPDGSLEGLSDTEPPLSPEESKLGEILLVGNILSLLCTLIGETLALRLIQREWPDASFVSKSSEMGAKRE